MEIESAVRKQVGKTDFKEKNKISPVEWDYSDSDISQLVESYSSHIIDEKLKNDKVNIDPPPGFSKSDRSRNETTRSFNLLLMLLQLLTVEFP